MALALRLSRFSHFSVRSVSFAIITNTKPYPYPYPTLTLTSTPSLTPNPNLFMKLSLLAYFTRATPPPPNNNEDDVVVKAYLTQLMISFKFKLGASYLVLIFIIHNLSKGVLYLTNDRLVRWFFPSNNYKKEKEEEEKEKEKKKEED